LGLKSVALQGAIVASIVALILFSMFILPEGTLTGFAAYRDYSYSDYEIGSVIDEKTIMLDENVNVLAVEVYGYVIVGKESHIEVTVGEESRIQNYRHANKGRIHDGMPVSENQTIIRYGSGPYDVSNDGIVGRNGAVDFYVETEAECVLWSVVSQNVQLFCHGSQECCAEYLMEPEDENANVMILDYERAGGDKGDVLAKAHGYSFSRILSFDFTGAEERLERLDGECIGRCIIDVESDSITIRTDAYLFVDRIRVYYTATDEEKALGKEVRIEIGLEERIERENIRLLLARENGKVESVMAGREDYRRIMSERGISGVFEDKPIQFFYDISDYQEYHSFPLTNYGSGVRVCIVDSGVDLSQLDSDISYETAVVDGGLFEDTVRHGTLVSRLITGLVPESEFVFVKVDRDGVAYDSDLIVALDICADYDADIISLSLGSGRYSRFCTEHPVTDKVSELYDNGVLVVAAAGNDGYGTVRMPACSPDALSVVRVNDDGSLHSGSSFVEGLSVIGALGEFEGYYGTSFSAPAVSAGVSVLLSDGMSTREAFSRIVGSGRYSEGMSYSVLDVDSALLGVQTNTLWENRIVVEDGYGFDDEIIQFLSGPFVENYTASDTFTVPPNVYELQVEAWGAGGGGGGGTNTNDHVGAGGAGGQFVRQNVSVVPGQQFTVTIGGGGTGGAVGANPGQRGGNTTFGNATATYVKAVGGAGGGGGGLSSTGASGAIVNAIGDTVYAGGSGADGASSASGGGGGGAGSTGPGKNASGTTQGSSTELLGGAGGAGTTGNNQAGGTGSVYGGAGGGGKRNAGGGAGAQGYLRVTYYEYVSPVPLYSSFDGATTNFSAEGDLENVASPILEVEAYGRIRWYDTLNVTSLNYDAHVAIINGSIWVNVGSLNSGHNSTANISFYDTGFVNAPVLYKDGLVCSSPDCNLTAFNNGYVNFTVSGFSNYTY
jgi:hypothetical protein